MESTNGTLRFGPFEVDLRTEELRKQGRKLPLPHQSIQVLTLLLERPGELVSREELRARLWSPEVIVDFDHGLNAAVNRLRDALGDDAEEPRFIETLPRRGYRFIAPVTPPLEQPSAPANDVAGVPAPPADAEPAAVHQAQTSTTATGPHPVMTRGAVPRGNWWKPLPAAALLLVATGGVWWRLSSQPPPHAIAVLPLKNLSREPDSDYFSDGLTDEIIGKLSTVDNLQVKSRTSSFVFKDKPRHVHDVGSQLGVELLLEGSVLRSGERLRISVDLVRVADDSTLWSQQYDRELKDVLAVQDEISRSIVNELRLKHVGGQRRYNTNLEAYDLYLRARSLSNSWTGAKLLGAIALYRQTLAKAPDFAPAYAGLADAYEKLRQKRLMAELAPDAEQQVRRNAELAIQLDPLLAEAHSALGLAQASDLAWGDAEHSFQHSLQINPNLARTHERYGMFVLEPEGRVVEAVQQYREAVKLDPLSAESRHALAFGLLHTGAYQQALEECRRAMALDSTDFQPQWLYARALWFNGHREEAIALFERLGPSARGFLGYAYAAIGRRSEAEQIALEEDVRAVRRQAVIYAGLGQRDRVLEAFEKLAAMHDDIVDAYPVFPEFALMRDDPRMKEFRRRRNLPWPLETTSLR
jgi:TolB-like protein/DNA-binding winged helix-turn-helix (wHTH) protein/Flp pilus assembly protein TadD